MDQSNDGLPAQMFLDENATPPLDGLPATIYVCRVCGGHGASRWGCWGRPDLPHDHVYMEPLHEIIAQINEGRRRR